MCRDIYVKIFYTNKRQPGAAIFLQQQRNYFVFLNRQRATQLHKPSLKTWSVGNISNIVFRLEVLLLRRKKNALCRHQLTSSSNKTIYFTTAINVFFRRPLGHFQPQHHFFPMYLMPKQCH